MLGRRSGHSLADQVRATVRSMLGIIGFLLIVWVALVVAGFLIKGLFWLAIIGIVLFLITGALGGTRMRR